MLRRPSCNTIISNLSLYCQNYKITKNLREKHTQKSYWRHKYTKPTEELDTFTMYTTN